MTNRNHAALTASHSRRATLATVSLPAPTTLESERLQTEISALESELTKHVLHGSDDELLRARRLLAVKREQLPTVLAYEADERERERLEREGSPAAQAARAASADATIERVFAPMLEVIEDAISRIADEFRNEASYFARLAEAQEHARQLHAEAGIPFVPSANTTSDVAAVVRRRVHATMKEATRAMLEIHARKRGVPPLSDDEIALLAWMLRKRGVVEPKAGRR